MCKVAKQRKAAKPPKALVPWTDEEILKACEDLPAVDFTEERYVEHWLLAVVTDMAPEAFRKAVLVKLRKNVEDWRAKQADPDVTEELQRSANMWFAFHVQVCALAILRFQNADQPRMES